MTNQKPLARIALIGDSLGGGGAENIHATLSNYLDSQGVSVFNIIFVDKISYRYSGGLLNLGKVAADSPGIIRKMRRFNSLRRFFSKNSFDAVIDFRMRPTFLQEWMLQKFAYPAHVVYTVHSAVLEFYFPPSRFLSRMLYSGKKLVAVSGAVRQKILTEKRANEVSVIHNMFDLERITAKSLEPGPQDNFILAVGRMNDRIKQFGKLIEAYSKTNLPQNGTRLVLLGEGKYLEDYKRDAQRLNVEEMVDFKGFVENPYPYYATAKFLVLSSKNEGFPNVIVEALACGTPVVSFDCVSGPREAIVHGQNGLLVDDQNFEMLAAAMEKIVADRELLQVLKINAKPSAQRFGASEIGPKWLSLLKIDVS